MARIPYARAVYILPVAAILTLVNACVPPSESLPGQPGMEATGPTSQSRSPGSSDPFEEDRHRMVEEQLESRGIGDERVLEAMRNVPRHLFVDQAYWNQAYGDHPLPIDHGQTISQPWIVAIMTEVLGLENGDRVLEIGTGSGYQAAILAEMGFEVYTVEIIPELADQASELLEGFGYGKLAILNSDGYFGWEEFAPFDGIIVTAAPDHLPQPLVNQLGELGRMVIPIGPPGAVQSLWLFEKIEGEVQATNLGPVRFVPFTRSPDPGG